MSKIQKKWEVDTRGVRPLPTPTILARSLMTLARTRQTPFPPKEIISAYAPGHSRRHAQGQRDLRLTTSFSHETVVLRCSRTRFLNSNITVGLWRPETRPAVELPRVSFGA